MKSAPSHTFSGVDLSIPTKVRKAEAEEEWQEVDWAKLSAGDVNVDGDSFLLVFRAQAVGGQPPKAMPLGMIVRANEIGDGSKTVVVTTTEATHHHIRLTFQEANHTKDFLKIAAKAEAAAEARKRGGNTGEVDDSTLRKQRDEADSRLCEEIRANWSEAVPPLIATGLDFYGYDTENEEGGEVLLGQGALVFSDPAEDSTKGIYDLLFYSADEGGSKAQKRFTIGPKSTIRRMARGEDDDEDEDSDNAISYKLRLGPTQRDLYTASFSDESLGECFARDFRLRQRLMQVSLKTAKGVSQERELLGQIEGLKQQTLAAQLWRLFGLLFALCFVVVLTRFAVLYKKDMKHHNHRPPLDYVNLLVADLFWICAQMRVLASDLASYFLGAVSPDNLRRCLSIADGESSDASSLTALRRCVYGLL